MQKVLIGVATTLLFSTLFFYKQTQKLQKEMIVLEANAKVMQDNLDRQIATATAKQKQLESDIAKQQQERKKQQITLQDKKCITPQFIHTINEDF